MKKIRHCCIFHDTNKIYDKETQKKFTEKEK